MQDIKKYENVEITLKFAEQARVYDVSHLLVKNSLKLSDNFINSKYKSSLDTVAFSLFLTPELRQSLIETSQSLQVTISEGEYGQTIFKGIIEPIFSDKWTIPEDVTSIDFTATETAILLDSKIPTSLSCPAIVDDAGFYVYKKNDPAHSLITTILSTLELSSLIAPDAPDLLFQVKNFQAIKDKSKAKDIIDTLLFEYGWALFSTEDKKLSWKPSAFTSADSSNEDIIEPEDILTKGKVSIKQRYVTENGVSVTWPQTQIKDDHLLYRFDLPIGDNDNPTPGELIAAGDYYPEDSDIIETWQKFENKWTDFDYLSGKSRLQSDSSLIAASNQYIKDYKDAHVAIDPIDAQHDVIYEALQCRIRYKNSGASAERLYWSEVYGKALIRTSDVKTQYPENPEFLQEYESSFIYDVISAERLAKIMHARNTGGRWDVSFDSLKVYEVGQLLRLHQGNKFDSLIIITGRSRTFDLSGVYSYKAVSCTYYDQESSSQSFISSNSKKDSAPGKNGYGFSYFNTQSWSQTEVDQKTVIGASHTWTNTLNAQVKVGDTIYIVVNNTTSGQTGTLYAKVTAVSLNSVTATNTAYIKSGDPAQLFLIEADKQTFLQDKRDSTADTIYITATIKNITGTCNISASAGTLSSSTITDGQTITLTVLKNANISTITITATLTGQEPQIIKLSALDVTVPNKFCGLQVEQTPSVTVDGLAVIAGDFFTAGADFTYQSNNYLKGKVYTYNGTIWSYTAFSSENSAAFLTSLAALRQANIDLSTISDPNDIAWFVNIVADQVIANAISANKITMTKEATIESDSWKDYPESSESIPDVPGFRLSGRSGLISSNNMSAKDFHAYGNSIIDGDINNPRLKTQAAGTTGIELPEVGWTAWYHLQDFLDYAVHDIVDAHRSISVGTLLNVSGTYNGNPFDKIKFSNLPFRIRSISAIYYYPVTLSNRVLTISCQSASRTYPSDVLIAVGNNFSFIDNDTGVTYSIGDNKLFYFDFTDLYEAIATDKHSLVGRLFIDGVETTITSKEQNYIIQMPDANTLIITTPDGKFTFYNGYGNISNIRSYEFSPNELSFAIASGAQGFPFTDKILAADIMPMPGSSELRKIGNEVDHFIVYGAVLN